MEVRGAQNIHSLDGTKHHPDVTPGRVDLFPWSLCTSLPLPSSTRSARAAGFARKCAHPEPPLRSTGGCLGGLPIGVDVDMMAVGQTLLAARTLLGGGHRK